MEMLVNIQIYMYIYIHNMYIYLTQIFVSDFMKHLIPLITLENDNSKQISPSNNYTTKNDMVDSFQTAIL